MNLYLALFLCLVTATLQADAFCLNSRPSRDSATLPITLHAISKPKSSQRRSSEASATQGSSWLQKIRLRRNVFDADHPEKKTSAPSDTTTTRSDRRKTSATTINKQETRDRGTVEIKTLQEFERYWYGTCSTDQLLLQQQHHHHDDYDGGVKKVLIKPQPPRDYLSLLKRLSIVGDTQIIGSKDHPNIVHPVVKVIHERRRKLRQAQKKSNDEDDDDDDDDHKKQNEDGNKVALVVEGGGMRGCVSAGMVCALHHLGLEDTVDVVYGSSAGAVVAAYFCSRQVPWFGPEVYYDQLTTAGEKFIDLKRLLRSLGFGLADPRLFKDVLLRPKNGKPLLNLDYLVGTTMQVAKPLDFEAFRRRQKSQPLKIVTTGLQTEQAMVLSQESGHFETLDDLCFSLHASCLLPGIAGPVMNVLKDPKRRGTSTNPKATFVLENDFQNNHEDGDEYEPLGDAMLSSPIPYDLAVKDGATHVIVIRSSPDGNNLMAGTAAKSMWESLIFRRFFLRKNNLPGMFERLQQDYQHQRTYASSILALNEAAASATLPKKEQDLLPHQILPIALEPGTGEVSHLESSREAIFEGVRQGFARAYDALVEDPSLRGQGDQVAKRYFPDEILDYDPQAMEVLPQENNADNSINSAFGQYMQSEAVLPEAWNCAEMETMVLHQYEDELDAASLN